MVGFSCWQNHCNQKWTLVVHHFWHSRGIPIMAVVLWFHLLCLMISENKQEVSRQTGNRNLMGPKTLPTIWGTYMKLETKYQISAINSCWEKCDEKCAYTFNVYKNQLSRQTGSRNLMGPKMLPTIWYTYMTLVTKYQISAINSYWEKCTEKYLGRTEGQTDRGKTVYPPPPSGSGGIKTEIIIQMSISG